MDEQGWQDASFTGVAQGAQGSDAKRKGKWSKIISLFFRFSTNPDEKSIQPLASKSRMNIANP
jgi:hypothetical protein